MTKKFCDRCEEPALSTPDATYQEPYGEPYRSLPIPGTVLASLTPQQCLIEVKLFFGFRHHAQGFGGPPDLCGSCRVLLAEQLLSQMRAAN